MADKLFDTLNVHNYSHGATARKPFQMPFTSHEDWRLKVIIYTCFALQRNTWHACIVFLVHSEWLENDFLRYLDNWKSSVSTRPGFSKAQRQTMMLSAATRYGLRMTGMFIMHSRQSHLWYQCLLHLLLVWSFIELVQYIFSIHDVIPSWVNDFVRILLSVFLVASGNEEESMIILMQQNS